MKGLSKEDEEEMIMYAAKQVFMLSWLLKRIDTGYSSGVVHSSTCIPNHSS